jgi:hypothetical protein
MAGYGTIQANQSGLTLYVALWNLATGNVVKVSDLTQGAFSVGQWANYKLVTAEEGGSGSGSRVYKFTMPAIAAGNYKAKIYNQIGGSPDIVNDEAFGEYDHVIRWDGASEIFSESSAVLAGVIAELASDPGSTPTLGQAIALLYMREKNANTIVKTGTGTGSRTLKNAAGASVLAAAVTDDGATYNQGKLG